MKTVLVTGFGPFGGDARNPSGEIAVTLDRRVIAGRRITAAVFPCKFDVAENGIRMLLEHTKPELVICLGLARARREITPERVAINVDDARIADNAGQQPIDEPIIAGAPVGYWSTLPVKAIAAALERRRVPAAVSQTAGTFVCNHVFYVLMHTLRNRRGIRGGFIHVPWPKDFPGGAADGLSFRRMVRAVETAIEVAVKTRRDIRTRGGAVA